MNLDHINTQGMQINSCNKFPNNCIQVIAETARLSTQI